MQNKNLIQETIQYVQATLAEAEGGHDWFHIQRVWRNAQEIAKNETVDMLIVELGALLHDIADSKFHDGDETVGPRLTREFLEGQETEPETIEHVVKIVENISYKGGHSSSDFSSPELDVVQDADRLDAIGAIGIARAFNYGGHKGFALYDPDIPPNHDMTKEEYKSSNAPTVNHFYEKLFKLKDLMNTSSGRQLAEQRHRFMEEYLDQFYKEWHGK